MKKNFLIISINLTLLFFFVFTGTSLAFDSTAEEGFIESQHDTVVEKKEILKEVEEIKTRESHIDIERVHDSETKVGEKLKIILRVENLGNESTNLLVTEVHKPGLEYLDEIEIKKFMYQGLEIPYYGWSFGLYPGESKELEYHVRPQSLGMILFSPTVVSDGSGNNLNSKPSTLKVTCYPDGECGAGENYIFCPEDCVMGSADGICDGAEDGICDPDCKEWEDPDCQDSGRFSVGVYFLIGLLCITVLFLLFLFKKKLIK